jgi:hypothetical protein
MLPINTEEDKWFAQVYPWELADCGNCLSSHAEYPCEAHPDLTAAARKAEIPFPGDHQWGGPTLESKRDTAIEIREQFAQYYTKIKEKP